MEMKKDPDHSKGRKPFFEKELVIVNIGVKQFWVVVQFIDAVFRNRIGAILPYSRHGQ